ncbi:B-cell receptor-associated protein 29 isoform X1 [Ornithorhynchus anatinus]|uniref:B-cell receptor-associated protein n=1 Tax=Ornithorhynchus anatinus TaxID=9258 RepID=A0A6I8NUP0_ORNAN|nr:B-cell receptor-associated protein 29 isoform X1 [Ornithorhynchus anatinus]
MSLQWVAVAAFLYAEAGGLLLLCLPGVTPHRWQKIFLFPLWGKIASFWNKVFLTIIILLIVLFLDAVREVRKYSSSHGVEKSSSSNPSASDHMQMKLFRSQRNLYLSGFSLFLWLVLRRTVTLITQLAKELGAKKALENQADSANEAAKNYMEENEKLKWIVNRNGKGDDENQKLAKDVEDLKAELKKTTDALSKARNEVSEVKKRSDSLSREYDRLLKEHTQLQVLWEETDGKKDL